MVQLVESIPEFESIINGNSLVVVDFFAEWCGPCRMIAPLIDGLDKATEGVVFIKVDVDNLQALAQKYDISAMPTFGFFKNGKLSKTTVGADIKKVKAALTELMA
ncbi:putative thioredoxin [Syncephalis plumigaleata]|nr:putative thioredoxin [Syncephalis plumigaleata]